MPDFPGGQTRRDIEARFQSIIAQVRRIASDVAASTTQTVVTTYIAKAVSVLRYSDLVGIPTSFAPSQHASTHAVGGTDPLTPGAIGAMGDGLDGGAAIDFFLLSVDANTATDGIADGGSA